MEGEKLDVLADLGRPHDRNVEIERLLHGLERVGRRDFEQRSARRAFHHGRGREGGPVDAEGGVQGGSKRWVTSGRLLRYGPRQRKKQGSAQAQSFVQAVPSG